ncbi:MAG: magnesium transporter [Gammaproteobacteria bacterium]|nr:magnesium transporter [Gammaproteobacteria bacterium]MDH4253522.1 magnesium transporter [Gammaproteobacteria bacterium]MDH5311463.1 magnesium transporter [Gammaproteobacteria bacterium]
MNTEDTHVWELLQEQLEGEDGEKLSAFVADLPSAQIAQALLRLEQPDQAELLAAIEPSLAAEIITDIPEQPAVDLFESLTPEAAASIMRELDSDVQADLLREIDDDDASAILAQLEPFELSEAQALAEFDPETAGGVMHTQLFSFSTRSTVRDVLNRLVSDEEDFERYRGQHPYVIDEIGRLVGVISLRNLLLSDRNRPLTAIMTEPISVPTFASFEELAEIFDENEFLGLPVVDPEGVLVGAISRADLAEAVQDRSDIDQLRARGIIEDELRSMPLMVRSKRRLAWLSLNIVLNIIAASVIAMYEDTLAAVIALAVFLPIVSDMSGCSGNQAVAVSLRELTLGVIEPEEYLRVWRKEAAVGLINGIALGILLGIAAWIWKGNPYLSLVVGSALALNTLVAVSIGGTVPLALRYFKVDPAVASGPILTTITDMVGFFLVLSLAAVSMPLLV